MTKLKSAYTSYNLTTKLQEMTKLKSADTSYNLTTNLPEMTKRKSAVTSHNLTTNLQEMTKLKSADTSYNLTNPEASVEKHGNKSQSKTNWKILMNQNNYSWSSDMEFDNYIPFNSHKRKFKLFLHIIKQRHQNSLKFQWLYRCCWVHLLRSPESRFRQSLPCNWADLWRMMDILGCKIQPFRHFRLHYKDSRHLGTCKGEGCQC